MSISGETVRALTAVIQHELPPAMVEMRMELERVRREVERARMVAEDIRTASISPYGLFQPGDPRYRRQTWREFAEGRVERCEELRDKIDTATDTLRRGRGDMLLLSPEPPLNWGPAFLCAHNSMVVARHQLGDSSAIDYSSSDDEDHSSVDEGDDVE